MALPKSVVAQGLMLQSSISLAGDSLIFLTQQTIKRTHMVDPPRQVIAKAKI